MEPAAYTFIPESGLVPGPEPGSEPGREAGPGPGSEPGSESESEQPLLRRGFGTQRSLPVGQVFHAPPHGIQIPPPVFGSRAQPVNPTSHTGPNLLGTLQPPPVRQVTYAQPHRAQFPPSAFAINQALHGQPYVYAHETPRPVFTSHLTQAYDSRPYTIQIPPPGLGSPAPPISEIFHAPPYGSQTPQRGFSPQLSPGAHGSLQRQQQNHQAHTPRFNSPGIAAQQAPSPRGPGHPDPYDARDTEQRQPPFNDPGFTFPELMAQLDQSAAFWRQSRKDVQHSLNQLIHEAQKGVNMPTNKPSSGLSHAPPPPSGPGHPKSHGSPDDLRPLLEDMRLQRQRPGNHSIPPPPGLYQAPPPPSPGHRSWHGTSGIRQQPPQVPFRRDRKARDKKPRRQSPAEIPSAPLLSEIFEPPSFGPPSQSISDSAPGTQQQPNTSRAPLLSEIFEPPSFGPPSQSISDSAPDTQQQPPIFATTVPRSRVGLPACLDYGAHNDNIPQQRKASTPGSPPSSGIYQTLSPGTAGHSTSNAVPGAQQKPQGNSNEGKYTSNFAQLPVWFSSDYSVRAPMAGERVDVSNSWPSGSQQEQFSQSSSGPLAEPIPRNPVHERRQSRLLSFMDEMAENSQSQ
ncbi:hypothetical protein GE09DRAFT_1058520 [Coniochaeta sp. 2T2.1]|nr:hypothetical protein GE09DRAFT_1058520 [Coniochaeta sp. 2T2.1]